MKNLLRISLLCTMILAACSPGKVYEKHVKMDNYEWNRFSPVIFQVPVENLKGDYDFILALRYMTGIPYKELSVTVTIESPSGEVRTKDYKIKIRDQNGQLLGDGLGDLWDLEVPLRSGYQFTDNGICKVEVESRMQQVNVVGLMEIGLIIRKSGR